MKSIFNLVYAATYVASVLCAGVCVAAGTDTTVLGESAGYAASADRTVFVGSGAGYRSGNGDSNVVVGAAAGLRASNARGNVLVGYRTGRNAYGLRNSIGIGPSALESSFDGEHVVALGPEALKDLGGVSRAVLIGGGQPSFLHRDQYGNLVDENGYSPWSGELSDWTDINHQFVVRAHKYDMDQDRYVGEFYIRPDRETAPTNAPIYYKDGMLRFNSKVSFGGGGTDLGLSYMMRRYDATNSVYATEFPAVKKDFTYTITEYQGDFIAHYTRSCTLTNCFVMATNVVVSGVVSEEGVSITHKLSCDLVFNRYRGREHNYIHPNYPDTESGSDGEQVYSREVYHIAEYPIIGAGDFVISSNYFPSAVNASSQNILARITDLGRNALRVELVPENVKPDADYVWRKNAGYTCDDLYVSALVFTQRVYSAECRYYVEPSEVSSFMDPHITPNNTLATAKSVKEYADGGSFSEAEAKMLEYEFDLYLAPWGDDANSGRNASFPKRTIAGCYEAAFTNSTVCVFPGDYEPISNEKTTAGSLFYPSHNLTFVAVGGRERTSITGKYTSDGIAQNGYLHTLAFNNGPQRFIGFTIRRLSGWSRSESQPGSGSNSPCMSCVVLEDCTVEDCDVRFWLSYGAFNTCAFADTTFRNIALHNHGSGNPPGVFIQCEFENCRIEVGELENHMANVNSIYFFEYCEARSSLFALPPVISSEKGNGARKSTFEDCTFVWDYNPANKARVWPSFCTNCYFCVGTSYSQTGGEGNVFASSWQNTMLDGDYVPSTIECPAVRTGWQNDAGWRQSGLGELKSVAYDDVVTVTNWNFTTELLPGATIPRTEKTDSSAVWHYVGPEEPNTATNDVTVAYDGGPDFGTWTLTWIRIDLDASGALSATTNTASLTGSAGWYDAPRLDFGGGYVFTRTGDMSYTTRYRVLHENDLPTGSQNETDPVFEEWKGAAEVPKLKITGTEYPTGGLPAGKPYSTTEYTWYSDYLAVTKTYRLGNAVLSNGTMRVKLPEYVGDDEWDSFALSSDLAAALGGCAFKLENGAINVYTNGVKAGALTFTPAAE